MAFAGHADLTAELNRLANGGATYPAVMLAAQGAANKWAGTTNLQLVAALNAKNSSTGLGLDLVCNQLAGTSGYAAQAALQQVAS